MLLEKLYTSSYLLQDNTLDFIQQIFISKTAKIWLVNLEVNTSWVWAGKQINEQDRTRNKFLEIKNIHLWQVRKMLINNLDPDSILHNGKGKFLSMMSFWISHYISLRGCGNRVGNTFFSNENRFGTFLFFPFKFAFESKGNTS